MQMQDEPADSIDNGKMGSPRLKVMAIVPRPACQPEIMELRMPLELNFGPVSPVKNKPREGSSFFFALIPPTQALTEIIEAGERFRQSHRLIGSRVDADRLHMTLCPLGRAERLLRPYEAALLEAAADVHMGRFEVVLDTAMRFSSRQDGQYPFVLCADDASGKSLARLRRGIAEAQLRVGLYVPGVSHFLPHITLLYGHHTGAMQESMPPIAWEVREFALIRSFFGQSRYEIVDRWPLS